MGYVMEQEEIIGRIYDHNLTTIRKACREWQKLVDMEADPYSAGTSGQPVACRHDIGSVKLGKAGLYLIGELSRLPPKNGGLDGLFQ